MESKSGVPGPGRASGINWLGATGVNPQASNVDNHNDSGHLTNTGSTAFITIRVPANADWADPVTWGNFNARLQGMSGHALAQQAVANAGGVVNVPMIFCLQ